MDAAIATVLGLKARVEALEKQVQAERKTIEIWVQEDRRKQQEINRLRSAIDGYLEKPGCNASQKRLAMRKLAWAIGIEL